MVWNKKEPATGRTKYIKRYGNMAALTTEKRGAEDKIPKGWNVTVENGYLILKRSS